LYNVRIAGLTSATQGRAASLQCDRGNETVSRAFDIHETNQTTHGEGEAKHIKKAGFFKTKSRPMMAAGSAIDTKLPTIRLASYGQLRSLKSTLLRWLTIEAISAGAKEAESWNSGGIQ